MIRIIYILLGLLSLAVSIFFFGNLLASCAGHPTTTAFGMWIMPWSLLGGAVFLYLAIFTLKLGHKGKEWQLEREAKILPQKVIAFLVSFVLATITYILISTLMLALAIVSEGKIGDWIGFILYPLFIVGSIYIGIKVYRRFGRWTFNPSLEPIGWKRRSASGSILS
jgi:hypothetical protein